MFKKKSQEKISVLNFHSTILTFSDPHCGTTPVIKRTSEEPILRFLPLSHESVARIGEKD